MTIYAIFLLLDDFVFWACNKLLRISFNLPPLRILNFPAFFRIILLFEFILNLILFY